VTISLEEAQRIGQQIEAAIHEGRELLKDMKYERQQIEARLREARQCETLVAGYVTAFQAKMQEMFDYSASRLIEQGNARITGWIHDNVEMIRATVREESMKALNLAIEGNREALRAAANIGTPIPQTRNTSNPPRSGPLRRPG
jgi:hypothetical protein